MHFASFLVALMPSLASAAAAVTPGHLGFALGMKIPSGGCKTQYNYERDFDAIAKNSASRIVRIYAASQCNSAQEILPAAQKKGFTVILGIWADTVDSYNADKAAAVTWGNRYPKQVYAITVGSETMYRGTFTGRDLANKVKDVRKSMPHVKIGTADTWNKFADGTANELIPVADILLCNAFSYWQGKTIQEAPKNFNDDISAAYAHIKSVAGSHHVELWVGETGWPTAGQKYESAVPSTSNANSFFRNGVCPMIKKGGNVFFFEAIDEPWKPASTGQNGQVADETHWGAMDVNRKPKYSLRC